VNPHSFVLSICALMALVAHAQPAPISKDLAAFHAIDESSLDDIASRNARLAAEYRHIRADLDRSPLATLADDDARALFRASNAMAFYTDEKPYAADMRRALGELERRRIATADDRERMFEILVTVRELDAAKRFVRDEHIDARLPRFEDRSTAATRSSLWALSSDAGTLTRHDYALTHRSVVIVVSAPWCHFTQDARRDIASDSDLTARMSASSKWILPQQPVRDFADIATWNRDDPRFAMELVYESREWPMISSWATPGFFFFRDGKIVRVVVGWPGRERLDDLREGFRRMDATSSMPP